jgi:hypothetical protein
MIIQSRFSTCKQKCHKAINTPTRLKTLLVCLVRKPTFKIQFSWHHHQDKGFAHVDVGIDNLLNKESFPTTKAREDSSMDVPTLKKLSSFSSSDYGSNTLVVVAHAWEVRFNQLIQAITSGITAFASYLKVRRIAAPWPT